MKKIIGFMLLVLLSVQLKAQKPKFVNQTNFGVLLGENKKGVFTLQNFSGIAFKKYNAEIGLVTGYDKYPVIKIIPLAFAVKYKLLTSAKTSPYFMMSTGYGFGFNKESESNEKYKGGFMFNPSFGLKFNNNGKIGYHFMVGYKTQKALLTNNYNPPNISYDFIGGLGSREFINKDSYLFKKVVLSFGVSF